jgi:hypothetical protein
MKHNIESLCARIIVLENIIHSLLSSYPTKSPPVSKLFHKSFESHVKTYFIFKHHFIPTKKDIHSEIVSLWLNLSTEQQSHWIYSLSS